jgi:hypothetical protein
MVGIVKNATCTFSGLQASTASHRGLGAARHAMKGQTSTGFVVVAALLKGLTG